MKNEALVSRLRDQLISRNIPNDEKKMFGGVVFMIRGNIAVGVTHKGDFLVRLDTSDMEKALKKKGVRRMEFTGRPMKNFLFVEEIGYEKESDMEGWIELALRHNQSLPEKTTESKSKQKSKSER